jgi:hypothetical protein
MEYDDLPPEHPVVTIAVVNPSISNSDLLHGYCIPDEHNSSSLEGIIQAISKADTHKVRESSNVISSPCHIHDSIYNELSVDESLSV